MPGKDKPEKGKTAPTKEDGREARLKAALRANLRRRKQAPSSDGDKSS